MANVGNVFYPTFTNVFFYFLHVLTFFYFHLNVYYIYGIRCLSNPAAPGVVINWKIVIYLPSLFVTCSV